MLMIKRASFFLLALSLFSCTVYSAVIAPRAMIGSVSPVLTKAKYLSALAPNQRLSFVVYLKYRNQKQLDSLSTEIYDPHSADYQKFLTKEKMDSQFAPLPETLKMVQQYFVSQGMTANISGYSVSVTGSVAQIEKTFQIKMNNYIYNGRKIFANATALSINATVGQYVSGIIGLDNIAEIKPGIISLKNIFSKKTGRLSAMPSYTSLQGFTGTQLRTTYQLNTLPYDGTGQTVVIFDLCGVNSSSTIMSDANMYSTQNTLPQLSTSNFAVVTLDSNNTTYDPYDPQQCTLPKTNGLTGWEDEIALDVEAVHTTAPGANIVVVLSYDANIINSESYTIINLMSQHTINNFTHAYTISNSFGAQEPTITNLVALDNNFKNAAVSSTAVLSSSGDCGDNTISGCKSFYSTSPTVQYPASSAYGTAIGGTSLFVDNNWNYAFESGWGGNIPPTSAAVFVGSGGGISGGIAIPSWQTNAIGTLTAGGYPNGTIGAQNHRALPDIGMLADSNTGLTIYVTVPPNTMPSTGVFGGTSLATPLFAGVVALINQERLANNKSVIGQVAPYLYNNLNTLVSSNALNLISPPHQILFGQTVLTGSGVPLSAFGLSIGGNNLIFGWDTSLTVNEDQLWNDVVGVGSPSIPNFVNTMATF